jgi:hypothetical protein
MGSLFFESPRDGGLLRRVLEPAEIYTREGIESRLGKLTLNAPLPGVKARWQDKCGKVSLFEFARLIACMGVHIGFDDEPLFWRSERRDDHDEIR